MPCSDFENKKSELLQYPLPPGPQSEQENRQPAAHRGLLKKPFIAGAVIGIPVNIAVTWIMHVSGGLVQTRPISPPSPLLLFGFLLATFGRPAFSMSYACGVALLFLNNSWCRHIMPFAAVGRTALSNYPSAIAIRDRGAHNGLKQLNRRSQARLTLPKSGHKLATIPRSWNRQQ